MSATISATWSRQILEGVAQLLDAAGAGVYKPEGYASTDIGIVFGAWPKTPVAGIKLTLYAPTELAGDLVEVSLQVHTRTTKSYLGALDMVDLVRDTLHRNDHIDLGQVRIGRITRQSVADLGRNTTNDLYEHTSNFRLTGLRWHRPVETPQGD